MFSGAKVNKNGTNQGPLSASGSKVTFGAASYDTHSWFDDTNDRLVVPVGVTKVRITANILLTSDPADSNIYVQKNTGTGSSGTRGIIGGDMTSGRNSISIVDFCVAGDFYELYALGSTATVDGAATPNMMTYFAIEALDGPLFHAIGVVPKTANFTLAASDFESKMVRMDHASVAIGATVPTNAAVPLPIGAQASLRQVNDAVCTVIVDTGVTIHPPRGGTLVLGGKGSTVTLHKVGADEWDLIGDVVPV